MSRIQSVDVFRSIAILAVIAIHTNPFKTQSSAIGSTLDLAIVINQAARFAVPFFFIISGYFWAAKFEDVEGIYAPTVKMAKRIAFLLIAWSIIYLLPWNVYDSFEYGPMGPAKVFYWNLTLAVRRPLTTIMQGTKVHLWFLVGLLCSLFLSAILLRMQRARLLIALAVTLYVIGLAGKAYADSPLGFHINFDFRNGPFFSLIFFVTGYLLQQRQPRDSWFPIGMWISIFGMALHSFELLLLHKVWGTTMAQDYVAGTYFFGTGAAIMALSYNKLLIFPRAALIGPLVLGIYVSQFIFLDLLSPVDQQLSGNWIWAVTYPTVVFLLSYMLAAALSRFPATRRLVA